jgi:hypothetical protein
MLIPAPLVAPLKVTPLSASVAPVGTVKTFPAPDRVMVAEEAPGPAIETGRAGAVKPEALV